jgi:hypothetical protein
MESALSSPLQILAALILRSADPTPVQVWKRLWKWR